MQKHREATEKGGSMVKCEKIRFGGGRGRGACENPVGLSMYESQVETVKYLWVSIGACLIRFCQKTAEMHTLWI